MLIGYLPCGTANSLDLSTMQFQLTDRCWTLLRADYASGTTRGYLVPIDLIIRPVNKSSDVWGKC